MKVDKYKCPIIKYSWVSLLRAVLDYEDKELSCIKDEKQSFFIPYLLRWNRYSQPFSGT